MGFTPGFITPIAGTVMDGWCVISSKYKMSSRDKIMVEMTKCSIISDIENIGAIKKTNISPDNKTNKNY